MNQKVVISLLVVALLSGCATEHKGVRQVDLDSWVDQPVSALETHPFFITVPVVKTTASDGTEIWNYVNGSNLGHCSGGGNVWGKQLDHVSYSQFASCVQRLAACNNIFYIREGKIQRYTPIGTGGLRCYTDEKLQPQFRGPANFY